MSDLTSEDLDILHRCTLFRGLNATEVATQLDGAVTAYPAGHFLVHEGETVAQIHVILSGVLRASKFEVGGSEFLYQQLYTSYLAGGEVACTPRKNSPYAIYTVTESRLWSFPYIHIEDDTLSPALRLLLLQNLLAFVANQNIRKYYKIDALSVKGARERILKYLTAQANRTGNPSFTVPFDREAMANYLCLNRSVLSHELKQMEAEGLIHFRKNQFTLL